MKYAPIVALTFAASLMSAVSYGQDDGGIPKEVLDDLGYYVDEWTTKVEFGEQVTEGTWSAKWSAEGTCILLHMRGVALDKEGKVDQEISYGTGIVGWDGATDTLKENVFWSNGNTYNAHYTKTSDTTWEGEAKGTVDGKSFTENVRITRSGGGEFVWKASNYVLGGEKQPDIISTMSRVTGKGNAENKEKLAEAFEWMIGDWELAGSHEHVGGWHMDFDVNWDIDKTVVYWRNNFESNSGKWTGEARHYWDQSTKSIKTISFFGPSGTTSKGQVTEVGDNSVVWTVGEETDGTTGQTEFRFSLQDDGTLLFLHVGILDDGTKKENWRFVLTKK